MLIFDAASFIIEKIIGNGETVPQQRNGYINSTISDAIKSKFAQEPGMLGP